eukprot:CAMPEP_0119433726 /NCGR_PEP_ID=MMETSP1335-20130426/50115_1 /TAXON_ID=259385 /ORGANISM="Chrysoculter rhomboideus, Strain RCC1486" /LENGTH=113 /DNA_ID=CAMNT_0007459573 /DNA_START=63 /DNA_END=401 /DNA_ORIENTATION=-
MTGDPQGSQDREDFEASGLDVCVDKDVSGVQAVVTLLQDCARRLATEEALARQSDSGLDELTEAPNDDAPIPAGGHRARVGSTGSSSHSQPGGSSATLSRGAPSPPRPAGYNL